MCLGQLWLVAMALASGMPEGWDSAISPLGMFPESTPLAPTCFLAISGMETPVSTRAALRMERYCCSVTASMTPMATMSAKTATPTP